MKRPLSPFEQELVNAMDEYAHRTVPPGFNASRMIARERQRVRVRISLAAVCVATAAGIASCVAAGVPGTGNKGLPVVGNTDTPVAVTGSPTPAASRSAATPPSAMTGGAPGATRSAGASPGTGFNQPMWPTTPTSSPFTGSVPPVPVLKSITYSHDYPGQGMRGVGGFTFTFTGQMPGYRVQYVGSVVREGSGAPVALTGSAFLQVTFSSAQAHDDNGNSTLNPPATNPVCLDAKLPCYVVNGDFEGTVTVTVGLPKQTGFRIGESPSPPGNQVINVMVSD